MAGAGALLAGRPACAQASPQAGPTLRIVGPWEIAGLEPATSGHFFTRLQVCETLVEADDTGRLQAGLAQSWAPAEQGRLWRFDLRENARFHDDSAVSAEAVARGLRRALQRPGPLRLAPVEALNAEGRTLHVRLREPFALLPALLAHSSAMVLGPASFDARDQVVRIIGSGPYRVTTLTPPQRVVVAATDPALRVQRASYLNASRAETRALMAESGQADMAIALDPASLARLRQVTSVRVVQVTVPRTLILKVNSGHPWLSDVRARRALSLAIQRTGIARGLLRDAELAATQLLPPTLTGWHQPSLSPLAFDAASARALWAELGWRPGPDGILQRGGERFELSLRTFPDRPELPLIAAAIQEQLRQTGIACRVLIGNSGDVPRHHRDGSLMLALAARHYALTPDPLGTLMQDFGAQGGDWGAMNWGHPALTQAIARLTRQDGDAAPWRAQIVRVLHDELPVIPIAWYRQNVAVAPPLAGIALDPLERQWRLTDMPWPGGGHA